MYFKYVLYTCSFYSYVHVAIASEIFYVADKINRVLPKYIYTINSKIYSANIHFSLTNESITPLVMSSNWAVQLLTGSQRDGCLSNPFVQKLFRIFLIFTDELEQANDTQKSYPEAILRKQVRLL